jgi:hypothetical protein
MYGYIGEYSHTDIWGGGAACKQAVAASAVHTHFWLWKAFHSLKAHKADVVQNAEYQKANKVGRCCCAAPISQS